MKSEVFSNLPRLISFHWCLLDAIYVYHLSTISLKKNETVLQDEKYEF